MGGCAQAPKRRHPEEESPNSSNIALIDVFYLAEKSPAREYDRREHDPG